MKTMRHMTYGAAVLAVVSFVVLPARGQRADPENGGEPPFRCLAAPPPEALRGLYAANTWPGGVVYFAFNVNLTSAQRQVALNAMAAISSSSNVTFVLHTTQPNWVEYRINESLACNASSAVGMVGGVQYIQGGSCAWTETWLFVHEIGHALGMWHEQQRGDRDQFVEIIEENILPGYAGNYAIVIGATTSGAYDFASTMHYDATAFSIGPATIRVKPPYRRFWQVYLQAGSYQSPFLSTGDKWALAEADMYPPAANLPPRTFSLTAPAPNVTVGAAWSPAFTWQSAEAADSFSLQVDDDPTFGSPEIDVSTAQTAYAHPSPLTPNTLYFWRVSATNAQGTTECFPLPWQAFYTAAAYPAALYVDDSAPPGGDGTSWATAMRDLKIATELAYASDVVVPEIRVAGGTYKPDMGSGDRSQSFILPTGCAVKGGYAGYAAPDPDARDVSLYTTILSGDLLGDDGPNFANIAENSYHVVIADAPDAPAALDGFTIRGGNTAGELGLFDLSGGGGLRVVFGQPTISHCTVTGNSAAHGGGVWLEEAPASLDACRFTNNRATNGAGGGAFVPRAPGHVITNCLFAGNTASTGGGGVSFVYSSGNIVNCTFAGNTAGGGGAVNARKGCAGVLTNCVLWGDSAPQGAEIRILAVAGEPFSTITVSNCDVAGGQAGVLVQSGSSLIWGSGNITPPADPLFVSPAAGDLHLMAGSPCIDAGDNLAVPAGILTDMAGHPRFVNDAATPDTGVTGGAGGAAIADMGALEFINLGDVNCDGMVSLDDLPQFVQALLDSAAFTGCDINLADVNGDTLIDGSDIRFFVATLAATPMP